MRGDEAILKAMSTNETVTNDKYEEAVKTGYAQPLQELLTQGLADEHRHKAWLEMMFEKL